MCVSFYFFPDSWRSYHSCQIWNMIAYFPNFMVRYGLKNLWMGSIEQIMTALLFREWKKIIVPSVKFNLGLLFISALLASVNSRPRLNFTSGTIIFHHSPHEQSIFVYQPRVRILARICSQKNPSRFLQTF